MRCKHQDWAKSVATSKDEQRQAITPLPLIATSAINVVLIERRQSARDTNPLNAKRKAEVISFEATSGLANGRDKNVVRAS
jgi:hypothetical protein